MNGFLAVASLTANDDGDEVSYSWSLSRMKGMHIGDLSSTIVTLLLSPMFGTRNGRNDILPVFIRVSECPPSAALAVVAT